MSQFCKSEKISTLVYSDLKYMQGGSELEIPFVLLAQEPSEVFTLQFSVLRCNVQKANEDDNKYVPLFVHQLLRTEQSISITDEFLVSDKILIKSVHIIFEIYRYNTKKIIPECKSPSEQFYEMLKTMEDNSDITIEVKDKKFPVHRNILSSKSNVFKAMCTAEMSENLKGVIKIEEFSPEIIEEMLTYIYTGKCQNTSKYSRGLFKVAHTYELTELQAVCEDYFWFNLNIDNVVSLVEIANLYDLNDLKKGAKKFMDKREKELVNLKVYQKYLCRNLSQETLKHTLELILKYDLKLVKAYVMKYIKEYKKDIVENKQIMQFLKVNPELMEEIFVYISQ